MQISSRFTIATHMLIVLALEGKKQKLTSDILAGSVGVNPVIIRKTLSQLKNAGMITVARGTGGAEIAKDLKDISLLDVYSAVECLGKSGQLFSFHDKPNPDCPIGKNIHNVLDDRLAAIQAAMEAELAQTSLDEVVAATEKEIKEQSVSQCADCFLLRILPDVIVDITLRCAILVDVTKTITI